MSKVQAQFHADPRELVRFACDQSRSRGLHLVRERFFPEYLAEHVTPNELETFAHPRADLDRIALCRAMPELRVASAHEFVTRNSDLLLISVAQVASKGLRESSADVVCSGAAATRFWRSVVRELTGAMHEGATVRNPMSGAQQPMPRHPHSVGAHELASEGVPMLAGAGWNEYRFDDLAAGAGG